ncbi:TonB-dependent receptor [Parapedobacter sp. SGR-10]|nr:TonB-dependent receptor [Parapedobacter sp. SGR-10]
MQVSALGYAQKITLSLKNASLADVLFKIKEQTGYNFLYTKEMLKKSNPVSIDVENKEMVDVLNTCFENQALYFQIEEKTVVVKEKLPKTIESQTVRISGKIVNENGEPLPGASVYAKGENRRVAASANGSYSITVKSENSILVFSYVGYESQEVRVGNRKNIDINMRLNEQNLDVVVVGYGQEINKIDLTGAVSQVNMEDVEKAPVGNIAEALQGRIAGVNISADDGQPGDELSIVIRGGNSLTQDNSPLYVIDGFPVEEYSSSSLNPDDIESINILKDASATSIYGARGANGVIVIETKKGQIGAPVVTFNNTLGVQQVQNLVELMSPYEFVKYQYEWNPSNATTRYLSNNRTVEDYKNVKGMDWQSAIFRVSLNRRHNIAVRGGNSSTRYAISGNIYNQEGIILNTGYNRYAGRVSLNQNISKKIDASINVSISKRKAWGGTIREGDGGTVTSALLARAWAYRPTTGKAFDEDEDVWEEEADEDMITQYDSRLNPVVTQSNIYNPKYTTDISANGSVSYKIIPSLTLRSTGTLFTSMSRTEAFYNSKTPQGNLRSILNIRGINASVNNGERITWSNNTTLNFNKTYKRSHKITALGGLEVQESMYKTYGYAAQKIPNESLGMAGMNQGIPLTIRSTWRDYALFSVFGRADYSYKSKYIFTATMRADASSKFSVANRWGYFPAMALGWNMDREKWFKKQQFVTSSKMRFSYGLNGNNRIGEYTRFPLVTLPNAAAYSWGNSTPEWGAVVDLPTPDIKWETTENMDLGLELGFLKKKVNLEIDFYRKNTRDLLMNARIPTSQGFATAMKNIGSVRNEGIEITLNTKNIKKKNFSWNSDFNISFNRGKILALNGEEDKLFSYPSFISQYSTNPLYIAEVGKPVGLFYGYVWEGTYKYADFDNPAEGVYVLKNNVTGNGSDLVQPGDIKYRDLNGDLTIDEKDLTIIGRGLPIHTGGFNNNFTYKNFSLNVFLQWNYGNNIYNANRLSFEGNGNTRANFNQYASYANRWTPENPDSDIFRTKGQGVIGWHSSRVIEDGSYLRLKTVALNYNLPLNLIRRAYMKKVTVGVAAQNLLTWTNYSGMDPEVSTRSRNLMPGFDYIAYPLARTVVFKLNTTF